MNEREQAILSHMHSHIPLTKAMAICINEITEFSIKISAPLEPNINHRESVFGGSIATLGITSGWALMFSALQAHGVPNKLVIQQSSTEFLLPAMGVFSAECVDLSASKFKHFIHSFERFGRARIQLSSRVYSREELVAIHDGTYVVVKI